MHGNRADFLRLRDRFFAANDATGDAYWISVGDWVHGPTPQGAPPITDRFGAPLYDYADETRLILDELFQLQDEYPGRVISLCGNHEWAHFGGPRTAKFHDDEAGFLEAQMSDAEVAALGSRFARWPIIAMVPSIGLVLTHGALKLSPGDRARLPSLRLDRGDPIVQTAMFHYGHDDESATATLDELSRGGTPYTLLVHGHDREEEGFVATSASSALLCTSFGARHEQKAYLELALDRPLHGVASLREGHELRRLWRGTRPV